MNPRQDSLSTTFAALADPTRRAILARLTRGPATVTDLATPFAISGPAVSKHLRVLESAGLVARRREGRVHHCRFVPGPMRTAADWIAHYQAFWEDRLDSLKRFLEQPLKEEKSWPNLDSKPPRQRPRRPSAPRARSGRRATGSTGRGRTRSS